MKYRNLTNGIIELVINDEKKVIKPRGTIELNEQEVLSARGTLLNLYQKRVLWPEGRELPKEPKIKEVDNSEAEELDNDPEAPVLDSEAVLASEIDAFSLAELVIVHPSPIDPESEAAPILTPEQIEAEYIASIAAIASEQNN